MNDEKFGTAEDYYRAFVPLQKEGISEPHINLLKAHFKAPKHTATWAQLAPEVGYATGSAVQLHYGKLARRVATQLGITEPPEGFWLHVLADWAKKKGPEGHTAFVLRRPVIEALTRLGIFPPTVEPQPTVQAGGPAS